MRKEISYHKHQRAVDNMNYTDHARDRMESRDIPEGVVGIILEYGEPIRKVEGADRVALTKKSLKAYRKRYGTALTKALDVFRAAYVVVDGNNIITVAFSRSPAKVLYPQRKRKQPHVHESFVVS